MTHPHRRTPFGGYAYILGYGLPVGSAAATVAPSAPTNDVGYLRLDVEPHDAQVFVDEDFIGTVEEFNRMGALLAGRHQVAIRAPGYNALIFSVTIAPGETGTFRDALTLAARPSAPDAASVSTRAAVDLPHTPDTFYVITGCYMGNRPPTAADLPSGCDARLVRTFTSNR
jgi:hypothetical protein